MPSCIKGFEYDVFVSYRQKDNLPTPGLSKQSHDGWVSSFVANLKKELEVTFKEPISVYFDENPQDGILDGHEVNDSVKGKLKCLIFIPIISQTYCDPKSFAWQYELLPFRKLASSDPFGMKVQLPNGNVISRILPIRIHELDSVDADLLANELGGPIRPIDFIFKSPGVNRPLLPTEDHSSENQLKIYYRDQVNKVANHIKEIIDALKKPIDEYTSRKITTTHSSSPTIRRGRKSLILAGIIILPIIISILWYQDFFGQLAGATKKTSIAVLPFKLIGNDEESAYLADGIQEAIRINLSRFPELKVKSRTSVERYRNIPKTFTEITQELNVLYLLEGSAQKIGDQIRVMVQLVDMQADVIWSDQFDRKYEDLFTIQNQISESIASSLKATLTPAIAQEINKVPTQNFEAYDLFLKAQQASRIFSQTGAAVDLNNSIQLFKQSIEVDPNFALGYGWLSGLQLIKSSQEISPSYDSVLLLANKALSLDSTVAEANLALSKLYFIKNDDVNALRYTYKVLENESMDSLSVVELLIRLGSVYTRIGDTEQAVLLFDALLKISPADENILHKKILALAANHQEEELLKLSDHIKRHNPQSSLLDFIKLHLALEMKNHTSIRDIYRRQKVYDPESDLFDQYALIFAHALRENGNKAEAQSLAKQFEEQYGGDPFYDAQLELHKGGPDTGNGLDRLSRENVGHYNLSLSQLNPVFGGINNSEEFKSFLERNSTRMQSTRERVRQLEKKGYLKRVSQLLEVFQDETEI